MAVCSNCGANDFVWAENLKTGTIGRGILSLRSGGDLSLGTRVCRGCGHADLFVKDPTVLRQPHTWRPGEFVPIPQRAAMGARAPAPSAEAGPASPAAAPTVSSPTLAPSPPAPAVPVPAPAPAAAPAPVPAEAPSSPAPGEPGSTSESSLGETSDSAAASAKKPARRRPAKSKSSTPPVTQD